jgi:hypothetical protein
MKLIQPVVLEVLTRIENSGSPMKCPFESLTPTCETKRCNNPKDKSVVTCDVCGYLIEYKWKVLMHNCVLITEYETVVLTCLHAGRFLRKVFAALAFVFITL